MNWLTDKLRPQIKTTQKRGVKAEIWAKCPSCGTLIYEDDLPKNLYCCTSCGHHLAWNIDDRLHALWDENSVQTIPVSLPKDDPLTFKDRKKYKDRLTEARQETGTPDAFRTQHGTIMGQPAVVVALDFTFMAGSMSRGVGAAVAAAAQHAITHRVPLLAITASGGARMQESTLSLMQMVRTSAAVVQLKAAGLPYLVLLCHPTTGGVTASFAMQGDVHIAEPQALIGFAGPRVIAQTIGQTLPEGFQTAEYLLQHGMIDMVTPRPQQRQVLANLLKHLTSYLTIRP